MRLTGISAKAKHEAAVTLGKERAITAGQKVQNPPKKVSGKAAHTAAEKLGHYGGKETAKHHKGKKK